MNLLSKSLWRRGVHGFAAICLVTLCVAFAPTLQNAAGQSADASLSGSVTDDGGAPIYRARVMVLTADLADTLATLFTDEQGIYSDLVATNVAIEESPVETADDLSIASLYPNPTGGEALIVTVAYTGPSAEQKTPMVELFDVLGRRTSPQSRLASGLYFVRLRLDADRVSDSHALVVSSTGEVAFRLQRSDPGTEFSSAIAAKLGTLSPHGKNGTTGTLGFDQVAALIRVEKRSQNLGIYERKVGAEESRKVGLGRGRSLRDASRVMTSLRSSCRGIRQTRGWSARVRIRNLPPAVSRSGPISRIQQ
ncbi:MAG: hypothetical protein R2832_14360 [Rhodothermales bacterium]